MSHIYNTLHTKPYKESHLNVIHTRFTSLIAEHMTAITSSLISLALTFIFIHTNKIAAINFQQKRIERLCVIIGLCICDFYMISENRLKYLYFFTLQT